MEPLITQIIIVFAVALGISLALRRRSDKRMVAWEALLREHPDGLTVDEIATKAGHSGWIGRGKMIQTLEGMMQRGRVEEIPPPPGTPHLKKIELRRYRLSAN